MEESDCFKTHRAGIKNVESYYEGFPFLVFHFVAACNKAFIVLVCLFQKPC